MRVTDTPSQAIAGIDRQKNAKLVDAAQQFEAMMTQELLKSFKTGQDGWAGEQQNDDAAADTVNGFGTEAVAKAIAQRGGLGIARQVVRQVERESRQVAGKKP